MDKLDDIINDYGFIEITPEDEYKDDLDPHNVKGLWDKKIHSIIEEENDN